jgi:hypothetical protein
MKRGAANFAGGCVMVRMLVIAACFLTATAARELHAATADEQAAELVKNYSGSLVFVEDKGGAGSGFVCSIAGKKFVLTNQHVVAGHSGASLTLLDQSPIKTGQAAAAVGHDIMSLQLLSDTKAMDMMLEVEKNAAIGDEVVVLGNTEGARVIKPLVGKLAGIGPNLIEVTAEFVPGNSGSPILHLKSGKVIGIATYLIVREVDSMTGQRAPKVRRFGYRLDSVKQWQPVAWPAYNEEFATIERIKERTHDLTALLREMSRTGGVNAAHHQNPAIRRPLDKFDEAMHGKALIPVDRTRAVKDLMGAMRQASESDIEQANARLRYDFFRKELTEEQQVRGQFYKIFDEAMKLPAK